MNMYTDCIQHSTAARSPSHPQDDRVRHAQVESEARPPSVFAHSHWTARSQRGRGEATVELQKKLEAVDQQRWAPIHNRLQHLL